MESQKNLYDVIVVGAGPAGLSAAIYMARARYKVLVLEKDKIGGQITITEEVVNYPGIPKTSGKALTGAMKTQAEAFGAEFQMAEVLDMKLDGDVKTLATTAGEYQALGVILATGANPRKLGFVGEKEFQGRGVAYCATCDGEFFTGKEVFVIGGGFAAVEEGIFLTKYASKVTMIVREADFTCARSVADAVKREPKITVHFHTEIVEAGGEHFLEHARFRNNETGQEWTYQAQAGTTFGIFVFAGYVPNTAWYKDKVACNEQGYLITDSNQKTNVDGVYGAGDVCIKNLRQVVTATRDGAIAATALEKHVSAVHEKLGLPEFAQEKKVVQEESQSAPQETENSQSDNRFISGEIRAQLTGLFAKFADPVTVVAELDESALSGEMRGFLGELEEITDKVVCRSVQLTSEEQNARKEAGELLPTFRIFRKDGSGGNLLFHGVPGGHEFNSFLIALYNMAGPGQAIDESLRGEIAKMTRKTNVKVLVSLSCTMCPEVVMATQRAASLSEHITAEMVDLAHYPELREKYHIMSVPCMVVNDGEGIFFGKKNLEEVVTLLK